MTISIMTPFKGHKWEDSTEIRRGHGYAAVAEGYCVAVSYIQVLCGWTQGGFNVYGFFTAGPVLVQRGCDFLRTWYLECG